MLHGHERVGAQSVCQHIHTEQRDGMIARGIARQQRDIHHRQQVDHKKSQHPVVQLSEIFNKVNHDRPHRSQQRQKQQGQQHRAGAHQKRHIDHDRGQKAEQHQ